MRFRVPVLLAAVALLAAMIVPSAASAHGTHLRANMNGNKVVGSPGAPNGKGVALLHVLRNRNRVCFRLRYNKIQGRTDLNVSVYRGRRGRNGNLQFTLVEDEKRSPIRGCVGGQVSPVPEHNVVHGGISKRRLRKILNKPKQYNVAVKNANHPIDGAIRGQLESED